MSEIYKALAKAQGEFLAIEKNRQVTIQTREKGAYTFRYADLDEILNKTRSALNKNGLALIQLINPTEQGLQLKCVLTHESGDTIESALPISVGGDPKNSGALITYYRRYLVTAILGVASDDDLDEDGQEAGEPQPTGKAAVREPERKPQAQQAPAANQAPAVEGNATPGEIAFIGKKVTAANLAIQEAYKNAGLNFTEAPMTKAEFKVLKDYLK